MTDTITYGAGWGTAAARMSDTMLARVEAADRQYERDAAAERRARAERAEILQEQAVRSSIEQALDRGEVVNMREAYANGGIGRTRGEFLAYASAQMDVEDAKLRRAARKEIALVGETAFYESVSADTSAPSPAERRAAAVDRLRETTDRFHDRAQIKHGSNIRRIARQVVGDELAARDLMGWSA